MKKIGLVLILSILPHLLLYGYSPSLKLSTGADIEVSKVEGEERGWDSFLHLGGLFFWRTKLAEKSFFTLAYEGKGIYDWEQALIDDLHYFLANGRFSLGPGQLILSAQTQASFISDDGGDNWFFSPDWELRYEWIRGRKSLNPFWAYQGSLVWEEDGSQRVMESMAVIGFAIHPSFRRGYEIRGAYGYGHWFEDQTTILSPLPEDSGETRGDHSFSLTFETTGLWGFYWDYRAELEGSLLLSNENRYLEADSFLEEDSEDFLSLRIGGKCQWTPRRKLKLSFGVDLKEDYYLNRKALNSDGSLTDPRLNIFLAALEVGADLTLVEDWTLKTILTGRKTFSQEDLYTSIAGELSLWLEYGL